MYEKLDVYDENRNKTGRIIERKEEEILWIHISNTMLDNKFK